jgi:SAM-dependent methyltransferase
MPVFDYVRANPRYGAVFNQAMTSYSVIETQWALAALANEDFSQIHTMGDVGGGHGHLACGLLSAYPHLRATVLDLPEVVGETARLWAPKLGLSERCRYVAGDMFREVPPADAYILKSVLHNWSDDESVRILANLRRAVVGVGRVFAADFVVPGPEESHFSKLFDIHMMLVVTGRERTAAEFAELLAAAGWRYDAWHRVPNAFHSVIAATAA